MNKKDLIKKYWFVAVIALIFLVFIGVYVKQTYDTRKIIVSSKDVDGKSVAYSVDGKDIYADDLYEGLYKTNGLASAFVQFQRAVLDKQYETTAEMKQFATNYAAYVYQTYGKETLDPELKSMGYTNGADDLVQYYIDSQKQNSLVKDYVETNWDDVAKTYVEENDPRIIFHILVKVADVKEDSDADGNTTYTANPTQEETDKLNKVLENLEKIEQMNIDEFSKVALGLSDDTGSAQNGGYIGIVTTSTTNYVKPFLDASLALKDNEVSEPITSQYGYHIIYNAGSSKELLLDDSSFLSEIENIDQNILIKAVMNKADLLNFEIVDEDLKTLIDTQLKNGEDQ